MDEDMVKILIPSFTSELEEFNTSLESDIIELEKSNDKDLINRVFRAFHSIKGSSGIIGFNKLSHFTHTAETLLEKARSGNFEITTEFIDMLLESNNIFGQFLSQMIENENALKEEELLTNEILQNIENTHSKLEKFENSIFKQNNNGSEDNIEDGNIDYNEKIDNVNFFELDIKLSHNIFETGNDPLMYLEDLKENGEFIKIKCDTKKISSLSNFDPLKNYLSWKILYKTEKTEKEIKDIFLFILEDNDINITNVNDIVENIAGNDVLKLKEILEKNKITFVRGLKNKNLNISNVQENKKYKDENISNDLPKKETVQEKNTDISNSSVNIDTQRTQKKESQFIKVDIRKIDELVKLVGEMVIGYSQISQSVATELSYKDENMDIYSNLDNFQRTLKDIQDKVMRVRMVPIGPTFAQFKLLIRDYTKKLNKKVKLELFGEDTELDKRIIEIIADPLRHMVRNSVDHGIETSEERENKGKSEEGTIELKAYYEEGNFVIEIVDDGKGIDKEKILEKAKEKGLYIPKNQKNIDDDEILNFIFEPGFSTASEISDLSGRGVGMDVVKSNIESIRGKIKVESELNKGTKFKISLPLTVSIIEGMVIKVGKSLFVLPLLSISELIKPDSKMIKVVEGKSEIISLRGEFIPLLRLYEEFEIDTKIKDPTKAIILIIEAENKKYSIMVDELIGQHQVVIKPLDKMFDKVKGITGASILGNGKVALILDAPSLIKTSDITSDIN